MMEPEQATIFPDWISPAWRAGIRLFVLLLIVACSSAAPEGSTTKNSTEMAVPEVRTARHIQKFAGQEVFVRGIYRVILDYSLSPPRPGKRAELLLKDGFGITIEADRAGLRSKAERKRFAGKLVRIRATLHLYCRLSRVGYFAGFETACLRDIRSIQRIPQSSR